MIDYTLPPHKWGVLGCRIRVFHLRRTVGHTTVIFRTVVATHPPPNILPLANDLHHTYQIDPDRLIWINHHPARYCFWHLLRAERFTRLYLQWDGAAFTHAIPEPLSPIAAFHLMGTYL